VSVEFLRRLPLFAELPEADLATLWQNGEQAMLQAGEWLMREGEIGDVLYVVLAGSIEITKRTGQQTIVLARRDAGEVIGEMALLQQIPRSASGQALEDSRVLKIDKRAFKEVLGSSPDAALALLSTMNSRLQSTEALLRQNEKMAALGTLAAGLAHELNNPAAAVQRSANQLQQALANWLSRSAQFDSLPREPAQAAIVEQLRAELPQRATTTMSLDPLSRGDRESEIQTWLEARNVGQAWQFAPLLVSLGYESNTLNNFFSYFTPAEFSILMHWIAAAGSAYALLADLKTGADRIAEIVKAVKTYAYLDQSPVQNVDIHAGLEDTLTILRHKLKGGVSVRRDYAPDLSHIEAYGSELNQVWTNLIDNAIDALQGQGELFLQTSNQEESVAVEISDNGPGISPDIQARIFDPFFTTKPPGAGTGLGLHIAYNIVTRHRGQIQLTSEPGRTTFRVTLPLQLQRG
jgi:signal transduction histidine kinase